MRKVLVVGASSSLGRALFEYLENRFPGELVGTYHSQAIPQGVKLDLSEEKDFSELSFVDESTTVVILAAISDPQTVYRSLDSSRMINVQGVKRLLDFCNGRGSRVVFASSVEALDGSGAPQTEAVNVRPLNQYGMMKAEIEDYIFATFPRSKFTIVRTPWICHMDASSRCVVKNTYVQMLSAEPPAFANDYLTGIVSGEDVCEAYSRIIDFEGTLPIVHVSADGYFSRAQLAELVLSKSKRKTQMRFEYSSFDSLALAEPRARDTRLDNSLSKNRLGLSYQAASAVARGKVDFLDRLSLSQVQVNG
jgi:dTDP-4-dehydrorhamnose reductase